MNVLIILPHLRTGGGENLALDEAIGLKNKGCKVKIMCLSCEEKNIFSDKAKDNNIDVFYLGKNEGFSLSVIIKLIKVIKREHPQVVHTHLRAFPYTFLASIYFNKIKFYHTIHTVASKEATGIMRKLSQVAYSTKKFTPIAISNYCAQTIQSLYKLKKESIPIIYNGIDTKKFKCKIPYNCRESSKFIFVSTGRFQKVKRHDLMIEAFYEVHKRYSNTELHLLGDGELRIEIEDLIKKNGLNNAIRLKGVIENVEDQLNVAHVYLICSDYEGLPLSVLEAMSCGLPIIATKAGGTVDIVDDSVGILCDIDNKEEIVNAMVKMIENDVYRENLSNNALLKAHNYDIKRCYQEYYNLFMDCIKEK